MHDIEKSLRAEMENAQTALDSSHSRRSVDTVIESMESAEDVADIEASKKSALQDKLELKKKELVHFISSAFFFHLITSVKLLLFFFFLMKGSITFSELN